VIEDVTTGEMVPPTPPEVTAAMEAERPPFFVPKFRAFYNEIVSHKLQKAEFTAGFATAVMDYTADLSPDAAAQQLQKRLCEILELQAAEATWMGGEAAARYPDAQYAMAALADEVFAHLEWGGRDAWPRHMVEQKLFKSNAKDVEFFKRVDKLLKNEADKPSAAARDLARMYLLVLAAGFEGKYRPFGLTRPLAEYRRRLYEFVSGKDPLEIYAEERKLFPEAADRVVVGRAVSRFSMLQQWAAVLVILLIGYAVISQMAWNRVSADLKDVTARVEAANSSATSDGLAGDPR
jgi:type IV/VI secretion system ImpK/VasF family protein